MFPIMASQGRGMTFSCHTLWGALNAYFQAAGAVAGGTTLGPKAIRLDSSVPAWPLAARPWRRAHACPSFRSDPSGEDTLSVQVPDSITSWVGEAVGLSAERGLGIAEPTLLKTFKPFFVDFTLPPNVVRGEQAKIPLSIYNYMDTCVEVPNPPSIHSLSHYGGEGWHP